MSADIEDDFLGKELTTQFLEMVEAFYLCNTKKLLIVRKILIVREEKHLTVRKQKLRVDGLSSEIYCLC